MKTLKAISIAILALTISIGVSAKNDIGVDSELSVEESSIVNSILFEISEDEEISMENWMTTPSDWGLTNVEKTEKEVKLEVEEWMLNPNMDNNSLMSQDEELKVENWMLKF